jgi:hypothetical protein
MAPSLSWQDGLQQLCWQDGLQQLCWRALQAALGTALLLRLHGA